MVLDASKFDEVSEFYVVEKAIIVVIKGHTIRIDALKRVDGDEPHRYQTRGYIEADVMVALAAGDTVEAQVWLDYDVPWTDGESAEAVLTQALALMGLKGMPY